MSSLSRHAEDIFSRLKKDVEQLSFRTGRLQERIKRLNDTSDALKMSSVTVSNDFANYTSVKNHYRPCFELDRDLFTPGTRPGALRSVYADAGKGGRRVKTETLGTQTEDDLPVGTSTPIPSLGKLLRTRGEKPFSPTSDFGEVTPLPTLEQKCTQLAEQCRGSVVTIDTSGSSLKLMSHLRHSRLFQNGSAVQTGSMDRRMLKIKNRSRRNTIAFSSLPEPQLQIPPVQNVSAIPDSKPQPQPIIEQDEEEDIYKWHAMSECPYEVLPFQKRRRAAAVSDMFASLRRPKKGEIKPLPKLPPPPLLRHELSAKESGTLSKFVKRSFSLRSSRRTSNGKIESHIYDELPCYKETGNSSRVLNGKLNFPKSLKGKLSLPISTPSQVLSLAHSIRNQPESKDKKREDKAAAAPSKGRPVSLISNTSLDITDSGCYRQGYQLDFPDECFLRYSSIPEEKGVNASPTLPTPHVLTHSDADSEMADSTYSCDQEGYFTSMHRDSGLEMKRRPREGAGHSPSTASSSSTVGGVGEGPGRGSSEDSGAEDLQSPLHDPLNTNLCSEQLTKISPRDAFPPLCEVSTSGEDRSESNSPAASAGEGSAGSQQLQNSREGAAEGTRALRSSSLPRPVQNPPSVVMKAQLSEEAFDNWLIMKFQKEMTIRQQSGPIERVYSIRNAVKSTLRQGTESEEGVMNCSTSPCKDSLFNSLPHTSLRYCQ